MKRFDRAMYAIFLLALLADVARSHAPIAVGGDPTSGMILSAATQLGVAQADGAQFVRRRTASVSPAVARLRSSGLIVSKWAGVLSLHFDRSPRSNLSDSVLLASVASGPGAGASNRVIAAFQPAPPSLAIFEHSGSPAP